MKKKKISETQSVFVVIPTIRDLSFLDDWREQFADVSIIVCEDRPKKSVIIPAVGKKIFHYSWQEIDAELGSKSWIIPRKVSAIRNYGFLKAYQLGADTIITLDDDCFPVKGHKLITQHLQNLSLTVPEQWTNTYPDSRFMYTRGIPYVDRSTNKVVLSHGLWTNVLDLDAPTHLQHLNFKAQFAEHFLQIISKGSFFPMCSMNLAFTRDITPFMYFPLMGEDQAGKPWGFDRFDDIWCGIFAKKIIDHLGLGVVNGAPFIEHRKASNPFTNLIKEAKGIQINEHLWRAVAEVTLTKKTPAECYTELANKVVFPEGEYFSKLRSAMKIWAELFS